MLAAAEDDDTRLEGTLVKVAAGPSDVGSLFNSCDKLGSRCDAGQMSDGATREEAAASVQQRGGVCIILQGNQGGIVMGNFSVSLIM